ncbi:MAG: hypothetical protein HRT44_10815 [Bdellovibrionales bacterium]|nr:hypothetical protein [Bdellovibrionales bacterium]NQZ19732.1 hypothetical protein [Bdellovibrionales bacterium]
MKFLTILIFLFSFKAQAFVTACVNYDVENTHPDDIRVSLFIKCMRKGDTIWLDGGVNPFLIDEFKTYNTEPIKKIYLNSGGGRVDDAIELAQFIRDNGITTIVRKNALCASACTLLFQAGTQRIAHRQARFMYHSVRHLMISKDDQNKIMSCLEEPNDECMEEINIKKQGLLESTNNLFDLYEEYGASPALREDYFNMPEEDLWWESGNFVGLQDWWVMPRTLKQYDVVRVVL